jgi:hypothetical protein
MDASQARQEFITKIYKNLCKSSNFVPAECSCADCKVLKREARKALKLATATN